VDSERAHPSSNLKSNKSITNCRQEHCPPMADWQVSKRPFLLF